MSQRPPFSGSTAAEHDPAIFSVSNRQQTLSLVSAAREKGLPEGTMPDHKSAAY